MSNCAVLVVVAHSDDETLGCGGTIAKHCDKGDNVYVAFMTDGTGSRACASNVDSNERLIASENALKALGVKQAFRFDFPDNQMDSVTLLSIVKKIESIIDFIKPSIIYTHFSSDLNVDHQITHKAVMTACRPQPWCPVKEIYSFEVLSASEWNSKSNPQFIPMKLVDVTEQWERKLMALNFYDCEMRKFPHSRSVECVEALAVLRGATHGINKAEAFFVERIITY